ncbi:MAG: DUF853 domain-containing protein, partial [Gammaproteobacteria bacterium]|nr:DUF853 domain-containing protein [Gammaproteobacteria bacterium]
VKGVPSMVDRTLIRPPSSRLGPATPQERTAVIAASFCQGKYEQREDRISAYEKLQQRAEQAAREAEEAQDDRLYEPPTTRQKKSSSRTERRTSRNARSNRQGIMEAMTKSVVRSVGSAIGRQIARGLLGSLLKGR